MAPTIATITSMIEYIMIAKSLYQASTACGMLNEMLLCSFLQKFETLTEKDRLKKESANPGFGRIPEKIGFK